LSSHETFLPDVIKPPSPRSTGRVFAGVAVVVAILWRNSPAVFWTSVAAAAVFLALSIWAPAALQPLNLAWFRFSILLSRVMNPIIMFVIFAVVFVPIGLLMRIWRDPLALRRRANTASYWVERQTDDKTPKSMLNQF
jgi:hypothetical protein